MQKKLEVAVLNWIRDKYNEPSLSQQIDALIPVSYDYTIVGCFTNFELKQPIPRLNGSIFSKRLIIGPNLKSPGIEHDGTSILWIEDGYISCLEMAAYGDRFDEDIDVFELYQSPAEGRLVPQTYSGNSRKIVKNAYGILLAVALVLLLVKAIGYFSTQEITDKDLELMGSYTTEYITDAIIDQNKVYVLYQNSGFSDDPLGSGLYIFK